MAEGKTMDQDAAATKLQGQARIKQAKSEVAAQKVAKPKATSVFELFDTDGSGKLSALEFCAGIEVILERAKTDAEKQAVQDFVGTSTTLWDLMSADAGWGTDIPVAQLPHGTPELWKKYLDANGEKDDAFLAFCKRGMGDLFDLIDADKSGALSVPEMASTLHALKEEGVDMAPWDAKQLDLYTAMSKSAGWGAMGAMNPKQLPHLTRKIFEAHMAANKADLAPFVAAVAGKMSMSAKIQSAAAHRVKMGLNDFS